MNHNSRFVAGLVTGAVVGAAVGMILDPVKDKHNRAMKSGASRTFRTLGNVIDGIIDVKF